MSLRKRSAIWAWAVLVLAGTAYSRPAMGAVVIGQDPEAQQARAERRAEAQTRIVELLKQRSVRPVEATVLTGDARRLVASLSDEQVESFLRGEDLLQVMSRKSMIQASSTAAGDAADVASVTASAIGDAETDLLFVPVSPCRIIDTRFGGGALSSGEVRSFEVTGSTGFAAQGGNAAGCGIPLGATDPLAPAIVVNFVAVGPAGPGHLEAWEFGQPVPNASVINYANVPGLNIANGVVVPIAGVSSLEKDLNIRANVSSTHVVADVTGYFTRFPQQNFQGGLKSTILNNDFTTLTSLADGACHELNSCSVTSDTAGTVIVEAWGQFVTNHASGTQDRVIIGVETVSPVVCDYENTVNSSDFEVSASLGTNVDVDFTVSHGRAFHQNAGVTRTYRLSGRMTSGANSGDAIENSRLICTFIPD